MPPTRGLTHPRPHPPERGWPRRKDTEMGYEMGYAEPQDDEERVQDALRKAAEAKRREAALILMADVEDAQEAYATFQEAWLRVGEGLRKLDEHEWHRVDAYPGWHGSRDVGAGTAMAGWMDEVYELLEDIAHPGDEYAHGE